MTPNMSLSKALVIAIVALAIGPLPLLIGVLLGFAAFVVTPVVMVPVLVGLGALIARMAPAGRWSGVALAALVLATAFVAAPAAMDRAMNGRRMEMYVAVAPTEFPTFTSTLATIVKTRGGEAGLGQHSVDEPRMTIYMLDASIGWISISANGTFRPKTEQHYPCSVRTYYTVTVRPYLSFVGDSEPVFADLKGALVACGYDVRDQRFPCEVPRPER